MVNVITNRQREWLRKLKEGSIRKKDNPQKYAAYERRIRARIDNLLDNLLWLAENFPNMLQDIEVELADETIPLKRRAKGLLKAITLFENEPTVLSLVAEIYTDHQIEITRKPK